MTSILRRAVVFPLRLLIAVFFGFLLAGACFAADAEEPEYPSGPITLIVPYAEGGGMDVSARLISKYASQYLGQPIEVANITQGGNIRGYFKAIQAPPDGYTLSAWGNGLITDSLLVRKALYTYSDVKAICMYAHEPQVIVVNRAFAEEARINALEDLFEYARQHPGTVPLGVGGNWTTHDFLRIKMERMGKVKFNRIPFLGGAPALRAAASGNCYVATPFVSELLGLGEDGGVVPLAVAYHERVPQFPSLASVPEIGYAGMTQSIWRVLAVPKHTPEPIARTLESAFRQAAEHPDFIAEAKRLGVNPLFMGMDRIESFLEKEWRFYSNRIRDWGIGIAEE